METLVLFLERAHYLDYLSPLRMQFLTFVLVSRSAAQAL